MESTEEPKKQTTGQPATQTDSNESSPQATRRKATIKKKIILVVAALVVAVALLSFTVRNSTDKSTTQDISFEQATEQTDIMLNQHKYDEALAEWDKFMERHADPEDQAKAHLGKALAYMNKQDFTAALEHYKKAEQLSSKPNQGINSGIINIAIITGDKDLEREYTLKAIDMLDPNHPLYEADKAGYERRIEELNAEAD